MTPDAWRLSRLMVPAFIILSLLIVAASVAGLIVAYLTQRSKHTFSFHTVFLAYFYIVSIISLLAVIIGTATAGTAVLSDIFGRQFSYQNPSGVYQSEPLSSDQEATEEASLRVKNAEIVASQDKQYIENLYRDDLLNGVSMLAVGLIFLVTHVVGWRMLDKSDRKQSFLFRSYVFAQLAIYSLATLIALPAALSELLRYWLHGSSSVAAAPLPGQMVALAVLVLPLWLFFVWRTIRLAKV